MAGYDTRQSTISDGNVGYDSLWNDEYNAILAAFAALTGHAHDGSAGEGGYVPILSDVDAKNKIYVDAATNQIDFYSEVAGVSTLQFSLLDGQLLPATTNDIDLGSATKKFKDLYVAGAASLVSATATGTVTGNQLESTVVTGTAPLIVASTTVVPNLNADKLDGQDAPTGTIVGTTDAQTLTNKTIDADVNTISNLIHGAEVDNPSAGVHGVTGTVVGTSDVQTLTNKTLTSPTINGGTHTSFTSAGIDDNATSTALTIDSSQKLLTNSSDLVGAESGSLTVSTGDSGRTAANSLADDLLIENNADAGITICTPNISTGNIFFADPEDTNVGRISYSHSTNSLDLTVNDSTALTIDSSQNVTLEGDFNFGAGNAIANFQNKYTAGTASFDFDFDASTTQAQIRYMRDTNTSGNRLSTWYKGDGTSSAAMQLNHDTGLLEVNGGQLKFPATQNASSDANTLDDYEEGTWTPTASDSSVSTTTGVGTYTKVGNICTVTFRIDDINTTGMTGGNSFYIMGLPFTAKSLTNIQFFHGGLGVSQYTATSNTVDVSAFISDSVDYIRIREVLGNSLGVSTVTVSQLTDDTSDVYGSITYMTA